MKKFNLVFPLTLLILVFAVLYLNPVFLSANDKDGKSCNTKTSCTTKTEKCGNENKAGGEWASYEFTSDQICCDKIKSQVEKELVSLTGVKEVKIGEACAVSGISKITILYDANEVNEVNISSFVQNINYKCESEKSCASECTGKKACTKEGADKKGCNTKKSKDSKDL